MRSLSSLSQFIGHQFYKYFFHRGVSFKSTSLFPRKKYLLKFILFHSLKFFFQTRRSSSQHDRLTQKNLLSQLVRNCLACIYFFSFQEKKNLQLHQQSSLRIVRKFFQSGTSDLAIKYFTVLLVTEPLKNFFSTKPWSTTLTSPSFPTSSPQKKFSSDCSDFF